MKRPVVGTVGSRPTTRQAGRRSTTLLLTALVALGAGAACTASPAAELSGPAASALIHLPSSPDPAAGSSIGPADAAGAPSSPIPPPPRPSTISAAPTVAPAAGTAAALASRLVVRGRAPMTGYDRDAFGPSWSDDVGRVVPVSGGRNGCDQRNDVLRRDLTALVLKPRTNGCVAASGTLLDPYTGARITFVRGPRSADVQVDHVVALADAWQKGAQQWDSLRRKDFAGDPLNLLAVKGSANQSKGAGDAATWLPPRKAFRCDYAARIVAVKAKYGVWVTAAEKSALLQILAGCPGQSLPAATAVAVPTIRG